MSLGTFSPPKERKPRKIFYFADGTGIQKSEAAFQESCRQAKKIANEIHRPIWVFELKTIVKPTERKGRPRS